MTPLASSYAVSAMKNYLTYIPELSLRALELNEIAEKLLSLPVSDFAYVMDLISNQLRTINELQAGTLEGC